MKRATSAGAKRHIMGRKGQFRLKGVMAHKYPDGMRPAEGIRTKDREHWKPVGQ